LVGEPDRQLGEAYFFAATTNDDVLSLPASFVPLRCSFSRSESVSNVVVVHPASARNDGAGHRAGQHLVVMADPEGNELCVTGSGPDD
jgi:hypothetical protein